MKILHGEISISIFHLIAFKGSSPGKPYFASEATV